MKLTEDNLVQKIKFIFENVHLLKVHELIYDIYKIEPMIVSMLEQSKPEEQCIEYPKLCQMSKKIKEFKMPKTILTQKKIKSRIDIIIQQLSLEQEEKKRITQYIDDIILKEKVDFIYENSIHLNLYNHLKNNKTVLEVLYEILDSKEVLTDLPNYQFLLESLQNTQETEFTIINLNKKEKSIQIFTTLVNTLKKIGMDTTQSPSYQKEYLRIINCKM